MYELHCNRELCTYFIAAAGGAFTWALPSESRRSRRRRRQSAARRLVSWRPVTLSLTEDGPDKLSLVDSPSIRR